MPDAEAVQDDNKHINFFNSGWSGSTNRERCAKIYKPEDKLQGSCQRWKEDLQGPSILLQQPLNV